MSDPNNYEGQMTEKLENQTSKAPSTMWLGLAIGSMVVSALMQMRYPHRSLFFGQWVAPFLLFGIYNKIVKVEGND